jgi:hypothetical protein
MLAKDFDFAAILSNDKFQPVNFDSIFWAFQNGVIHQNRLRTAGNIEENVNALKT